MTDSDIFAGLNDGQKQAVEAVQGPVLVVAGPGSGKTLTMVRRIARLVQLGVSPGSILAVTFTNRAAREMKERVQALLGDAGSGIFIGTFHLLGLRIIREHRESDFTVLGRDEQAELLQELMKGSRKEAQQVCDRISRKKNFLEHAAESPEAEATGASLTGFDAIYASYEAALQQRNAFDFDDLIKLPVELLEKGAGAHACKVRFSHIIVDEYQDINPAQYRLLRLLMNGENNVCAVGDSDQAIYAFRGVDIGSFLNFERDFPGARRIALSMNYRSTGAIVAAADAMIRLNAGRTHRTVAAAGDQGELPIAVSLPDERAEAETIIREIEARMGGTSHDQMRRSGESRDYGDSSYRFSDFAVVFRTKAQAKTLEEAFLASGMPYQVIGRSGSMQSREIEATSAFLRSFLNNEGEHGGIRAGAGPEAKLLTPADFFDPRADAVALMTMHMAKGLEFRVVFVAGCGDGLVPCRLMKDGVDVEEERRLLYVAMTRAKSELFLLHARSRFLYGQRCRAEPSPFLADIPDGLIERRTAAAKEKKEKTGDRQIGLFS